ncbi:LysR family transcriptional regulator [Vibrio anguillarum]|uniref:LysR family transcriptional regulator n=1 Tax=Vibrio anguillarum TaxID=55601 RepID=UPI00188C3438|nr:LysR family transcriptional regulator [Vibrio anguillarum]MBF4254891.1 LysR family transcriptional regulator [Vibrio anguillarum]MBF4277142.1 LysR family transcriptional regulator [Vibrio anguillarum]MBF4361971.1 LysR family transcriptional regulator [Vibrio anguillarum]MBF4398130.1 LysR family transcriptional regulator [Vibrio anguillarum]MBF4441290.1 LysR family transcriptional regulator [Vibrio anguillarum]
MLVERAGQMVIFAALIKHRGFTAAAKSLGVSVSHVSKQLALLEASLGVKLVQRTTRSFTTTEAGEAFYRHCIAVVGLMDAAQSEMESQRDEVSGLIKLGLSQSFGSLHILPALEALRQRYPKLQVEVHLFDYRVDMLEEGLDLWVTNNEHLPEGYVAQRLADCQFVLAASPEYLLNHSPPQTPGDLLGHNCLIYRSWERDYIRWSFANPEQKVNINVSGNYSVDLAEAVRDAAVAGWGVAYLATYLIRDEFRTGKLIQLLPDWHANQSMPFYAVYPSRQHMPKKTSAVIEFIKALIGTPCYWDTQLEPYIRLTKV